MPTLNPAFKYQIGGSLKVQAPCYVERQADQELYEGLRSGMFCYVLNSRQMGKSSLRVQTMYRLSQDNVACGVIDITAIGSQEITAEQWYASIISSLISAFRLNINLRSWWLENLYLSPVKRLNKFVEEVLLVETSQNIVVFIDEIDSILSLPFSVDDFFAWIRSCYNKRTDQPAYQRLTFVLLGVATPSDLIQDKNRTPFNIGQAISLNGFVLSEAQPLADGLIDRFAYPQKILAAVLNWTGGQPFLTQKICQLLLEDADSPDSLLRSWPDNADSLVGWVAQVVRAKVIDNWVAQDEPEHLKTIRDRILRNQKQLNRLLGIYGQILEQGEIPFGEEPEQMELLLSGLVVRKQSQGAKGPVLQVHCRIYQEIFNRSWLEQELVKLRPYSESIRGWLASQDGDESRLLRGNALAEALAWADDKKLSDNDYRFLNASQALEAKTLKSLDEQRWSKFFKWALAASSVAILLLSGLSIWAVISAHRTVISEVTALNSFSTSFYTSNPQSFDALLSAVRAKRKIQDLIGAPPELAINVQSSLQKALGAVKERNRFAGHNAPVMGASFSPDGQTIASASWDRTIRLWNKAGKELRTLKGHGGEVWNVVFSPDGQLLASGSSDKTVKLWRIDGTLLHTFTGHQGFVGEVVFSPDGQSLASTGADGYIKLWSIRGEALQSWKAHDGMAWGVAFSSDGQTLVSGGADRLIQRWSLDGKKLQTILGHEDTVNEVIFSADGQQLASVGNDGTVRLWNLAGKELKRFTVPGVQLWDLHFSPDGQTLAATCSDSKVRLWSLAGQKPMVLNFMTNISRLNFSSDGEYLILAGWDSDVRYWKIADPVSENRVILAHDAQLNSLNFSHDGKKIVTASWDRQIKLWGSQGEALKTLKQSAETKNFAVWDTVFSPDDQVLAAVIWDGRVLLWDSLGNQLGIIPGESRLRTTFSPDGEKIVSGGANNTFKLWSLTGQALQTFVGHQAPVTAVQFSADGRYLVSGSADRTLKLWKTDGKLLQTFSGHQGEVMQVRFSPDRQFIASGSNDGTLRLWKLNGQVVHQMNHGGKVMDIDFDAAGQLLASASTDHTVKLWSLQGKAIETIDQHTAPIMSLAFSPNGQVLASGGFDNNLILTDLRHLAGASLDGSLQQACDWLLDYLNTSPQAEVGDRQFCTRIHH